MKRFKRILRPLGLVCLIALAVFGVGIAGGVPIPSSTKREHAIEVKIELLDTEENAADLVAFDFQQ
ncbi:MAG: hypothetical protein AB8B69_01790 [Chitinophagales bacterium]